MKTLLHSTLIAGALNIAIILLIGATIYITLEPVALIGLLLLQKMPTLLELVEYSAHGGGNEPNHDDPESNSTIGFTAQLRK